MHVHLSLIRKGMHGNKKLTGHVAKYGICDLSFFVLEYCDVEMLVEREQYYMDLMKPSFNIVRTAGNTLGYRHTNEARAKMSNQRKGNQVSLGRRLSDATKDKIRSKAKARGLSRSFLNASIAANAGRKHSKEHRYKIAKRQLKVTPEMAHVIFEMRRNGVYQKDIAKELGISQRLVVRVEQRIGVYGDKDYFEAGCKRFELFKSQLKIF